MSINPQFKLLNPTADGLTGIRLFLYFNKKRFVYGVGEKIAPALWDDKRQRPTRNKTAIRKAKSKNPYIELELNNITATLDDYANEVRRVFSLWKSQSIVPTKDKLRKHLDRLLKGKSDSERPDNLNGYIDNFIKELESGNRTTTDGKRYATGTIKNYKGFQTQFQAYQKAKRVKLDFEHITTDFYDSFIGYFNSKDYSQNTIGRHVKNLKVIMRAALDEGLHRNKEFERKKFKTIKVEVPSIYLAKSELEAIRNLSLSGADELARDVFLVGCYTAQRFSDYSRIRPTHLKTTNEGTKVLEIIQKKTKERVIIPIRPELHQVLSKYDYHLPKTYEQKVNDRIKEIGKLAGVDSLEIVETVKGGKQIVQEVPKYQLIKTHTARRTGATLMYLDSIPPTDIMKITGHTTVKALTRYIKVTKEETADRLAKHSHFAEKKAALKAV